MPFRVSRIHKRTKFYQHIQTFFYNTSFTSTSSLCSLILLHIITTLLLYLLLMSLHIIVQYTGAILLHLKCNKYETMIQTVCWELIITHISHLRFNGFCNWANLIHFQQKTVAGFFLNGHFDATKRKRIFLNILLQQIITQTWHNLLL